MRSGKKDDQAKEMFDEAAKDIEDKLVKVSPHGLTYIAEMKYNRLEHKVSFNINKMINNKLVLVRDKGRGLRNPVLRLKKKQVDEKISWGLGEGFLSFLSSFGC